MSWTLTSRFSLKFYSELAAVKYRHISVKQFSSIIEIGGPLGSVFRGSDKYPTFYMSLTASAILSL